MCACVIKQNKWPNRIFGHMSGAAMTTRWSCAEAVTDVTECATQEMGKNQEG